MRVTTYMGTVPNKYVYAVDRKDVMAKRNELIAAAASRVGMVPPVIRVIKSARDRFDDGTLTVRQDISRVPDELTVARHIVLIITHEALRGCSWEAFRGWHLIIDEVPNLWDHEERQTPAHVAHFQAHYDLERVEGTSFSMVRAKPNGITLSDYQHDATAATWATFHKRVTSEHGVYVNIQDWREMAIPGAKWSWYSIWDVHELEPFGEVWIVGNAFEHSVTYGLIQSLFGNPANPDHKVEFEPLPTTVTAPTWAPRNVRVLYMAKDHVAGTYAWTDEASPYRDHQHKWADWIAGNSDPENHYWTGNLRNTSQWTGKIPGKAISPKIAGSNEYRELTTCSVCYTAKGSPDEIASLGLFSITPDLITRSREHEDLIQIVFRSSLRLRDDTRDVELRVYDRVQAEFLAAYFQNAGFPFAVELVHIDIGLDDVDAKAFRAERKLARKLKVCMTDEERAAVIAKASMTPAQKEKARRDKKRAEREAAGEVIRPRGRPRKAA